MAKFKKLKVKDAEDPTINVDQVESVRPGEDDGECIVHMAGGTEYPVDDPMAEVVAYLAKA